MLINKEVRMLVFIDISIHDGKNQRYFVRIYNKEKHIRVAFK